MKPPFAYYGGKSGMAHLIAAAMPAHHIYLEPFFGSGAVLFAKSPATHEVANDLDGDVVNFFRVLRDRQPELEHVCALTPHARAEFAAACADDAVDELERARRFWVRVNQSFAKTAHRNTGWSMTIARTQAITSSISRRIGRFAAIAERLQSVSFEQRNAIDLIDRFAASDECVIYADPPYLASTRRKESGVRTTTNDYQFDMGTDDAHEQLADALHRVSGTVILSGYASPLYEQLYGDWERFDLGVTAHSANAKSSSRTRRVESVWCNQPIAWPFGYELEIAQTTTRSRT